MTNPRTAAPPDPAATVSKAVVRTAAILGLTQAALAEILGISKATASRLAGGTYQLDLTRRKEWELALLFVRMFRALDAVAGHGETARAWLRGPNLALGCAPIEAIVTAEGLVRVVQYLDAVRGRI